MSIDNKTTTEVKTLVTAVGTTEASFRTGLDHVINGLDNIVENQIQTSTAGTAGQFLTSDGSGNLSWSTVPSVTVNQTVLLFIAKAQSCYGGAAINANYQLNLPRMSFLPEVKYKSNATDCYSTLPYNELKSSLMIEFDGASGASQAGGTYPSADYTCKLRVNAALHGYYYSYVALSYEYITL